jgi:hypothetical protein
MHTEGKGHECVVEKIKSTWAALSGDDVALYEKDRDKFFEKLNEKLGLSRDVAAQKIKEFEATCDVKH